jgi:hypothetical protein
MKPAAMRTLSVVILFQKEKKRSSGAYFLHQGVSGRIEK